MHLSYPTPHLISHIARPPIAKMSQDQVSKTKEKKSKRDAAKREERQKKGRKRKRDESEIDEKQEELKKDFIPLDLDAKDVEEFREVPNPLSRKRNEKTIAPEDGLRVVDGNAVASESKSKKRKKDKHEVVAYGTDDQEATEPKRKKSNKTKHDSSQNGSEDPIPADPKSKKRKKAKNDATENGAEDQDTTTSDKSTKPRFILFIGNLPYSTTDASLQRHFKKLSPFTLRHRTDPKTKKSKGFAFLEFENFDRMKTCIKLYHHSTFDPTKLPSTGASADGEQAEDLSTKQRKEKGARRINVELTAGGGGSKAEGRMEKIMAKNVRLDEQRKRRLEEEKKQKAKEEGKKVKKAAKGADSKDAVVKDIEPPAVEDDNAGMHPARLARMMN